MLSLSSFNTSILYIDKCYYRYIRIDHRAFVLGVFGVGGRLNLNEMFEYYLLFNLLNIAILISLLSLVCYLNYIYIYHMVYKN